MLIIQSSIMYIYAGCVIEEKIDYPGNDIKMTKKVENQEACAKLAAENEKAKFWTYRASTKECWIKTAKKGTKPLKTVVSGNRECGVAAEEDEEEGDGDGEEKEGRLLTNSFGLQDLCKIQLLSFVM